MAGGVGVDFSRGGAGGSVDHGGLNRRQTGSTVDRAAMSMSMAGEHFPV